MGNLIFTQVQLMLVKCFRNANSHCPLARRLFAKLITAATKAALRNQIGTGYKV